MIMSEKIKPSEATETPVAGATEQVPDWLSNRLRRIFSDVMDEPVPDEFKALLKQLEEKEQGQYFGEIDNEIAEDLHDERRPVLHLSAQAQPGDTPGNRKFLAECCGVIHPEPPPFAGPC